MALLRSGTRIYGNATIDTVLVVNGSDATTSNSTGALKVAGGIGVVGNIFTSANITSLNANLGNLAKANYFQGTLVTSSQPNITSLGELTSLTVNGNTILNGNLVVTGTTTTVSSNNTTYADSILELHTDGSNALTVDDGRDVGVRVHYFKSTDKQAFFGFSNDTQAFEYYVDGTESNGAFSGTYGNFKGSTYISNVATGTAPLQVNSTTEVANLTSQFANVANTASSANTAGTVTANAQPNITSVGTLSSLTVSGLKTLGLPSTVKITGGVSGQFLKTDGAGNLSWSFPLGYGNANVSGNTNEVQFNDGNNLAASSNFTFDATSNTLTVTNISGNGSLLTSLTAANIVGTVANANYAAYSGNTTHANVADSANSVAGANVTGAVAYATTANSVAGANVSGTVANATYAITSGTAYSVSGSNVSGEVAYAAVANSVAGANVSGEVASATYATSAGSATSATTAGTVTSASQPNITSVGRLSNLTVGNSSANTIFGNGSITTSGNITAGHFIGDGSLLTGITASSITGDANLTNITVTSTANMSTVNVTANSSLGNVGNVSITGGSAGQFLKTDGNGNLNWANTQAFFISNVSNIVAGSALEFVADYANADYPAGVFTVNQLGPVSITATDIWQGGTATKNAYANYIANTVNTSNVSITLSLANANFSVQSTDTITLGSSTITGASILALNITGTGGTYTIPSANLNVANTQTNASVPVTFNLTTSRGIKSGSGTTLVNNQPVPFNITSATGTFASSTVPYWSLNQTFSWTLLATTGATGITGNLTYSNTANSISGSLTSSGALTGTSTSLDSTLTYTISTTDYNGTGGFGAGQRTIPSTVTGTVAAATKYYPLFWKTTSNSTVPTFTTSDTHNSNNYVLGQGANTTTTATDYLWLATPNSTSHTFKHVFLGSDIVDTPDVTSTTTISGQTYKIWGFTNFSQITTIVTTS